MRYWHPLTEAAVAEVKAWRPERIVLLPLYPQYSTTTSQSFLAALHRAAAHVGLDAPTTSVCCYPTQSGMIEGQAQHIASALAKTGADARVLFSAHGLPKRIAAAGDPYAGQVEMTARAVVARLGRANLDWQVCYQSRVGPMKWLSPYDRRRNPPRRRGGEALVVVPIAFVSEHSETLVELDIEYRHLADKDGVPAIARVPALEPVQLHRGLAELVRGAEGAEYSPISETWRTDLRRRLHRLPAQKELTPMENWYLWIKSVHVIAVIAWMAGLLYLPRLFVYHAQVAKDSEAAKLFVTMEKKLMHMITVPAAEPSSPGCWA